MSGMAKTKSAKSVKGKRVTLTVPQIHGLCAYLACVMRDVNRFDDCGFMNLREWQQGKIEGALKVFESLGIPAETFRTETDKRYTAVEICGVTFSVDGKEVK